VVGGRSIELWPAGDRPPPLPILDEEAAVFVGKAGQFAVGLEERWRAREAEVRPDLPDLGVLEDLPVGSAADQAPPGAGVGPVERPLEDDLAARADRVIDRPVGLEDGLQLAQKRVRCSALVIGGRLWWEEVMNDAGAERGRDGGQVRGVAAVEVLLDDRQISCGAAACALLARSGCP
jgi:hypothetical protein